MHERNLGKLASHTHSRTDEHTCANAHHTYTSLDSVHAPTPISILSKGPHLCLCLLKTHTHSITVKQATHTHTHRSTNTFSLPPVFQLLPEPPLPLPFFQPRSTPSPPMQQVPDRVNIFLNCLSAPNKPLNYFSFCEISRLVLPFPSFYQSKQKNQRSI